MYRICSSDEIQEFNSRYKGQGGVYKLHCLKKDSQNEFIPIDRILGTDPEGVLYIGQTGSDHRRIAKLRSSLSPGPMRYIHHAGIRYKKNQKLQNHFPSDRLCITFKPVSNPKSVESKEIQDYFNKFGEVPPLNGIES